MSGNHWKTLFVSLIYCICFVLVSLVTQFPPGFGAMFNTTISIASGTRWLPAVPAPRTTLRSLSIDTWDSTKSPGPWKTAASVKVPAATGTRPIQPIICQPSDSSLHSSVPVYRLHESHAASLPLNRQLHAALELMMVDWFNFRMKLPSLAEGASLNTDWSLAARSVVELRAGALPS